ncbi:MAG: hypothetical protein A3K18_13730 [Lentisphaerae bacterium RIFOXYA12_64_32]|nr:MAG: hypothetical protein A3K18_13730 [Lentisphaerae bacterium RIFOXYA12_64_32]
MIALLADARDIVLTRAESGPPPWAVSRLWQDYLLTRSEADLDRADTEGISNWFLRDPACPPSLRELAERTLAVTTLIPVVPGTPPPVDFPSMSVRKRGQVAAILHLLRESFPALSEIVDVGAGRGHVTARASSALSVPAVGFERDPERVAVARTLAGDLPVRFITADVLSPSDAPLLSLPPRPDRLLMALHGCGELGDALVTAAVAMKASVLHLACCPQKIRGRARHALVPGGPTLPREILGLANVPSRTAALEGERPPTLASKKTRLALRYLLAVRGWSGPVGEEMRGLNRRKADAEFAVFAKAACQARGFPEPTPDEIAAAAGKAHATYVAQRRLAMPRSMLGRALEIFLALDRALYLRNHGYDARVLQLFPAACSPRNLAVLGRWPGVD